MKHITKPLLILSALLLLQTTTHAQSGEDSTGLPGDHFSLNGALEMFKQSSSPEDFEKRINTKDNNVNNLDLNGDGDVDYVKVIGKSENNAHAFVLQVPVSETENQDIAVIELEKTGDTTAVLQIIGDADIYGEELIVEASDGNEEPAEEMSEEKLNGPSAAAVNYAPGFVVINVWRWPSVRFVYGPVYKPWVSPWHWKHHPVWFHPWRTLTWVAFHPLCHHYYHPGFRVVHTYRVVTVHNYYKPFRMSSVAVRTRNAVNVNNYRVTRTTKSRTVTGPGGNQFKVKQTSVKVKDEDGDLKGRKTKTTVRRKRG